MLNEGVHLTSNSGEAQLAKKVWDAQPVSRASLVAAG
jgi:hypothetical protein